MIIKIKNLRLKTVIGVYGWENSFNREIVVNAEIKTNHIDSMTSDKVEDTIDYDSIVNKIKHFVENNHCKLIEKMVGEILTLIMQDKRICSCTLEIDKLKVYDFVDSFSITETRTAK
jgi:dihydroneopterin aldolase